jgi:hypothetical protein
MAKPNAARPELLPAQKCRLRYREALPTGKINNGTKRSFFGGRRVKKWSQRKILVVICSLVFVVVAPLISTLWWQSTHNLQPLSVPISLKHGEYTSPYFTTDLNNAYQIQLDWDRFPDALAELDLDWKVVDDTGMTVQQGTYSSQIRGGDGATLGEYRPKRGLRQRIILRIHQDVEGFDAHHPILKVSVPETMLESSGYEVPLAIVWAGLITVLGVATLLFLMVRRRRAR